MIHPSPAAMFAALDGDNVQPYLATQVEPRLKAHAEEDWPSKSHPENIYAKDESVKQFTSVVGENYVLLTNESDHGDHANRGTTRRGPGTAKPWYERGGEPYLDQTAAKVLEAEPTKLLDHLTGGG